MSLVIGKRLKELRKGKLTQEQLAQYLEVDQTLVAKLENGTRGFNSDIIDKICILFGCTEEYLAEMNKISAGKRDELLLDAFRADIVYNFDVEDMELND